MPQLDRTATSVIAEIERLLRMSTAQRKRAIEKQLAIEAKARKSAAERGLRVDLASLVRIATGVVQRAEQLERQVAEIEAEERRRG
jgi:hypothetical protein